MDFDRERTLALWQERRENGFAARIAYLRDHFPRLREVRRLIPRVRRFHCRHSLRCCSSRPMSKLEFYSLLYWAEDHMSQRDRADIVARIGRRHDEVTPICPFLDRVHQVCTAHMARPVHCHTYGIAMQRCPYNLDAPIALTPEREAKLYEKLYSDLRVGRGLPADVAAAPFEWWFAHHVGDADLLARLDALPAYRGLVFTEPLKAAYPVTDLFVLT